MTLNNMAMNKLVKHIFVILLMVCFNCTTFAQREGGHMRGGGGRMHGDPRFYRQPSPYMQQPYRQPNIVPYRQQPNFNNRVYRMPNPNAVRRVQAVKEHFLSRQLALTPEQSERFWPVYRQYQNELSQVRILKRLNNSNAQVNGSEQIRKDLEYESQLVDIRRHYNEEFLRIMPAEKVSELYKSERGFTDELIKNLNERNGSPPQ
jgi:hypothetical protein